MELNKLTKENASLKKKLDALSKGNNSIVIKYVFHMVSKSFIIEFYREPSEE